MSALPVVPIARICDCVGSAEGRTILAMLADMRSKDQFNVRRMEDVVRRYVELCEKHETDFRDQLMRRTAEWLKNDSIVQTRDGADAQQLQISAYKRGNGAELVGTVTKRHKKDVVPTQGGASSGQLSKSSSVKKLTSRKRKTVNEEPAKPKRRYIKKKDRIAAAATATAISN